ncbi:flagellar export chaperone FlgN [Lutispora thermophila]|uniref:FlgN protein n=1 Tax=Lutispora thermophila DSM 19022 TaxID=1122184 RepID=A0A1M6ARI6_9FIRM|nr:flagellar export chaperone FlgN [Lutispora thermophila]SHI39080.1 FlgN protein [Lutispora thermophila DSM 19022]
MGEKSKDMIIKIQSLLEEKKAALEEIYELTLGQKNDIENNEGENLHGFIDKKQVEIDKIKKIDEDFEEAAKLLKEELQIESFESISVADYPEFKNIKDLITDIMDLARSIMELEEQNKIKVQNLIDDIKKDIKMVNSGQKFLKAYDKPNINISGIYIDSKK